MNALIYKLSLRNGLILAGISTVITIVFYLIDPMLQYTSFAVPIIIALITLALFIILIIDVRRKIGGFWTFGEAYLSSLVMSVVVIVAGLLVSFIIFKFVDPTLPTKVNDVMMEATSQRLEKFGMDQTQIDVATKQFTDGKFIAGLQPTLFNELKNFGITLLIYAVVDLIIAACVKKNKPMFAPIDESDNAVV